MPYDPVAVAVVRREAAEHGHSDLTNRMLGSALKKDTPYSYDDMQGKPQPSHMGSQSLSPEKED